MARLARPKEQQPAGQQGAPALHVPEEWSYNDDGQLVRFLSVTAGRNWHVWEDLPKIGFVWLHSNQSQSIKV